MNHEIQLISLRLKFIACFSSGLVHELASTAQVKYCVSLVYEGKVSWTYTFGGGMLQHRTKTTKKAMASHLYSESWNPCSPHLTWISKFFCQNGLELCLLSPRGLYNTCCFKFSTLTVPICLKKVATCNLYWWDGWWPIWLLIILWLQSEDFVVHTASTILHVSKTNTDTPFPSLPSDRACYT